MKEVKKVKTVSVEISETLLNKLAWAFPAGNVEDQPPCKTFEYVTVIT
jgi:hypothetical protein